jgi:hypothetical protein
MREPQSNFNGDLHDNVVAIRADKRRDKLACLHTAFNPFLLSRLILFDELDLNNLGLSIDVSSE